MQSVVVEADNNNCDAENILFTYLNFCMRHFWEKMSKIWWENESKRVCESGLKMEERCLQETM